MSDGPRIRRGQTDQTDFALRTTQSHIFDDFLKVTNVPGPHEHIGVMDFEALAGIALSTTDAGGIVAINPGGQLFAPHANSRIWTNGIAAERIEIEWRFQRWGDPSIANQETVVGLLVDVNNYIGIGWGDAGLANFRAISYVAGVRRFLVDTGVAKDNAWHRARMTLSGFEVDFYLDDVLVYNNNNLGVDFVLDFFNPAVWAQNAFGTADVDWVDIKQFFAGDRIP